MCKAHMNEIEGEFSSIFKNFLTFLQNKKDASFLTPLLSK